jgi:two-component system response regulator MprA
VFVDVALTPTEFRLLALLIARRGQVVRRRALVAAGWPEGAIVTENTLDTYVARIRRKVAQVDPAASVSTVRGVGYRFD